MYNGVPTLNFLTLLLSTPTSSIANPKSASLQMFFEIRILAGLMSLCKIPIQNNKFNILYF